MKRASMAVIIIAIAMTIPAASEENCIKSSQHYEGSPKPSTYIVTVINTCNQKRVVTVKIVDARSLESVKEETFPIPAGETRAVVYEFQGEKLLSYSIFHQEE